MTASFIDGAPNKMYIIIILPCADFSSSLDSIYGSIYSDAAAALKLFGRAAH